MKEHFRTLCLLMLPVIILPLASFGQSDTGRDLITLYLQPSEGDTAIGKVPADDPIITNAEPVMDESMARMGWYWNERPGTYRGFIDPDLVGKDLLLPESTLVFLRPEPNSPVLATLGKDSEIEILERTSSYWLEIAFEHPVPVYFRSKPEAAAAEVVAEPVEVAVIRERRPEPMEVVAAEIITTPDRALAAQSTEAGSPRYFQGVLRPYRPGFLNFNPVPFHYELVTPGETRIAFVELRQTILTGSIDRYLNQPVLILGTPEVIEGHRNDIVIRVINLRNRR